MSGLDEHLGNIHEIALLLAMRDEHELAMRLGEAHEAISNYLVSIQTEDE